METPLNMADPIIDSLNQPPSKHWWQSKTIWGLAIAAFSIALPKYQPIAEVLPTAVDNVAALIGLALATYGRIKADKPITK